MRDVSAHLYYDDLLIQFLLKLCRHIKIIYSVHCCVIDRCQHKTIFTSLFYYNT